MILANCLVSCRPDLKQNGASQKYFDLKGYFTADAARLTRLNSTVTKMVEHNGVKETRKVKIDNWLQEFELFIASDINKPAWKNSYTLTADDSVTIYRSNDKTLKTFEIMIKRDKQKVKWIVIFNYTQNMLYRNTEELTYYPDSAYKIDKVQQVKVIGKNVYRVYGTIDK
jgi:hypothetical protein